eukprot:TRINITY_DN1054_c0_g2_i1.p1 TRINITY_DN1054_c0_g2~~TRINITY_DN1054_c0_g2_i1.p1  ORF type:complete len:409 (+),score=57.04 TRINITY_DN1054_c0_g2_i1:105-1331(+)
MMNSVIKAASSLSGGGRRSSPSVDSPRVPSGRTPRGASSSRVPPTLSQNSAPAPRSARSHGGDAGAEAGTGIYEVVTESKLNDVMAELSQGHKPWSAGQFVSVKRLQDAKRNHGFVELMKRTTGDEDKVAVKQMPTKWVRKSSQEFDDKYPKASERPWVDISIVKLLNDRGFDYVCKLHGIFRDAKQTYFVSSFADQGDLFIWCDRDTPPGPAREAEMRPIAAQVFTAVRYLHDIGIAHRDLSLENILLTEGQNSSSMVKIIDFGMATLNRTCCREVRGKLSYQAPEMHMEEPYDTFLVDHFAIGVVLFAMCCHDYPWMGTAPDACQLFACVAVNGFRAFIKERRLRKAKGTKVGDVMSPEIVDMLEGLLQLNCRKRHTLGERGIDPGDYRPHPRPSALDCAWVMATG